MPVYRLPLDVQSGELPVLPLSITGAVTFARLPTTDSFLSGTDCERLYSPAQLPRAGSAHGAVHRGAAARLA